MTEAETMREVFSYNPETGDLTWKFTRNVCAIEGKIAGHAGIRGYRRVRVNGKNHSVHRIIWLLQTGEWPVDQIDHINGVRDDNRWKNLRQATQSENQRNVGRISTNSSGVKGVFWDDGNKRWRAQIVVGGKNRYLGLYSSIAEASEVVQLIREMVHGTFARHA